MQDMQVLSLGPEDPLEEEMATYPTLLAWKIPWTEEPGGLQSMGSQSQTHIHNQDNTVSLRFQEGMKSAAHPC